MGGPRRSELEDSNRSTKYQKDISSHSSSHLSSELFQGEKGVYTQSKGRSGYSNRLVQELLEPVNSRVLRSLQTLLLLGVALVTTGGETVDQTGVVVVVERNVQSGQSLEGKLLELGSEHGIGLGRDELHRNTDVCNLALLKQRRVGDSSGIDQRLVLAAQTQDSPGTVAETNGADFFVLRLEFLCICEDFRVANLLAVAADEGHDVELLALLGV